MCIAMAATVRPPGFPCTAELLRSGQRETHGWSEVGAQGRQEDKETAAKGAESTVESNPGSRDVGTSSVTCGCQHVFSQVNLTMSRPGLADAMDFDFYPFGNACKTTEDTARPLPHHLHHRANALMLLTDKERPVCDYRSPPPREDTTALAALAPAHAAAPDLSDEPLPTDSQHACQTQKPRGAQPPLLPRRLRGSDR